MSTTAVRARMPNGRTPTPYSAPVNVRLRPFSTAFAKIAGCAIVAVCALSIGTSTAGGTRNLAAGPGQVWTDAQGRPVWTNPFAALEPHVSAGTGSTGAGSSNPAATTVEPRPGVSASSQAPGAVQLVDVSPVITELAANGIPTIALAAYERAAAYLAITRPSCGITWSLLAAIGRVESDHGQYGGAVLHVDGTSTPPVIGIALDGRGTALIRDTDHGKLDGDTVYDRAVGPMQFIPSTWALYATDGNDDGNASPFDIFDAARAAATYLCTAGGDLTTAAGRHRAVQSYNDSDEYVATVLALADVYASGGSADLIPPEPAAPRLTPPAPVALPPVDPGPPPALDVPSHSPSHSPSGTRSASLSPTSSLTPGPLTTPGDPSTATTPSTPRSSAPSGPPQPSTSAGPTTCAPVSSPPTSALSSPPTSALSSVSVSVSPISTVTPSGSILPSLTPIACPPCSTPTTAGPAPTPTSTPAPNPTPDSAPASPASSSPPGTAPMASGPSQSCAP